MKTRDVEYVVFDVETTGLSPQGGDRIVEIAAVRVKDLKVVDSFESLINPRQELSEEVQKIHSITNDMLKDAQTAEQVLPRMLDFIRGGCLVGHNIKFDLNFLCFELALIGRKLSEETPALDTLKMAKELLPHLTNFRLPHVAHFLGASSAVAHRALPDVKLTAQVMTRLMDIADTRHINTFSKLHKHFGVPKPNFAIEQVNHEFAF